MKVQKITHCNTKYCKIMYIPALLEKVRHTLFRFGINLIPSPPAKRKDLVSSKIAPDPER